MDNIKLREMLLQPVNTFESYKLINLTGMATLNHAKHDEDKAIKAFYNISLEIKNIINKENYCNLQFSRGEKKEFSKMLYKWYINKWIIKEKDW